MTFPPGPRAPQIVQMLEWLLRPVPFLERNSRRYGDFFRMRIAGFNAIVVADPEIVKQIVTGAPETLHAGEANAGPLEPIVGRNSVLLLDGSEHMRQRKLMLPSFRGENMRAFGPQIAEITKREIERFPIGEPFAMRTHTQAITLEVIMQAVFGIHERSRLDTLRSGLVELLSTGTSPLALASIALPPVRWTFGRRSWSRFLAARERVDEILFDEIRQRRTSSDLEQRTDVLSILLQATDEQGEPLTDAELRDELMTLLAAGHETTATALAWGFDLLLHSPDKLARLTDELDCEPEGGAYLDAVINETLRLRPVIPAFARVLQEPLSLNGYVLPAGTRVAPNVYLTHRRPDVYPEPERFLPERFLDNPPETYSWIPFGGGIRRCLGAAFALYEMKIVFREILTSISLSPGAARPEAVRRRAITFAPQHDTIVVAGKRDPLPVVASRGDSPVPA